VENNGDCVEKGLRIHLSSVKFSGQIQTDELHVDLSPCMVLVGCHEIRCSPIQFSLLRRWLLFDGAAVARDELLGRTESGGLDEKNASGRIRYQLRNLRIKWKRADVGED